MAKHSIRVLACSLLGCHVAPSASDSAGTASEGSSSSPTNSDTTHTSSGDTISSASATTATASSTSTGIGTSSDATSVGSDAGDEFPPTPNECTDQPAGIACNDNTSVECDGAGNVVDMVGCSPQYCVAGIGCAPCVEGLFDCLGNSVYACNTDGEVPAWEEIDTCDASAEERCDLVMGQCVAPSLVGDSTPTGVFYGFSTFSLVDQGPATGVDSYDDFIYVNDFLAQQIDVYQVTIDDSDGDGVIEPNQHPDDPARNGPIEQRTLTFVESLDWAVPIAAITELYALDDRLIMGGPELTEYLFASEMTTTISEPRAWTGDLEQIGYEDVHGIWYASHHLDPRRVLQQDPNTGNWGIAFDYSGFVGDQTRGIESVTDPNTGLPYLYICDLATDMIGQYYKDPESGWTQVNLFQRPDSGLISLGMGYGALGHFWSANGGTLEELGGGDMTVYLGQ